MARQRRGSECEAELQAGVAKVELPCGPGQPMMGYGARTGRATRHHDPLYARALYLERCERKLSESSDGGPRRSFGRALVIECDLCLVGVAQALRAREEIAARTGLEVGEILLGCIHTHSGPDSGIAGVLAGRGLEPEQQALLDAAVQAGVEAVTSRCPARLGAGTTRAGIGRNRRREGAVVDPEVTLLRVDRHSDGATLAVLYVYGCHPTVLGHDNLAYSADWPGAAAREIEARVPGAMAIFVLGAHADVDPRTRGLLDLAIADQSVGRGFEVVEELGREVGRAVWQALRNIETRRATFIGAASRQVELVVHGGEGEARQRALAALRARALEALGLPSDAAVRTGDLYRLEREGVEGLADEALRDRIGRVREYLRDRTASRIAGGERVEVEIQCLQLGEVSLLGLPLEVTSDVGLGWKAMASSAYPSVVSIANGWLRYLPAASHFAEPNPHHQYEVLNATFEANAADTLLAAGRELAETLADRTSPDQLPDISH